MKKNLKLFILLSVQAWKITFQGRLAPLFFLVGKLVRVIFLFIFIVLLFGKTRLIKGYSFDELLIFYLTFNIIDTLGQILYREVYRFRPLVLSGSFDLVLLKPFHPFIRILIGGIDYLDILLVVPYFLITFFIYQKTGPIHIQDIASYLFFLYNSLVLVTAFHILVLCSGIITTDVDHTIMIYRDLTGMGRFPMEIYREPLRAILTFVIPVGIMMNIPSKALMGALSLPVAAASFVISWGMLGVSLAAWNFALKKYQSWGG
jgi:ABC-2 type transport system permease protein